MKKRRPRRTALFHACYFLVESSRSHWVTVQKVCVFNGFGVVPYECVDHAVLVGLLNHKIKDARITKLIYKFLKAGYLENWQYHKTYSGTPQGGIISPLLANIYLHELDKFVMGLKSEFDTPDVVQITPDFRELHIEINRLSHRLT